MTRLKRSLVACAAATFCGALGIALAQQSETRPDAQQSGTDSETATTHSDMRGHEGDKNLTNESFVTKAAQANMAEIELSKLALQKSQDQEVRDFAQRMVQDHSKASQELKTIAQKHNVAMPRSTDAKHQEKLDKMREMSGAEFDRAYTKQMEKDHEKAVSLFTNASEAEGLHEELKSFASKTLPTLQTHDRLAADLRSATGESRAAQAGTEEDTSTQRR